MFEALLKGFTLGLLLSISVGPVVFSIIKQSLNSGHRGGIAFILGVSASDIALVLISNVFTEIFGYMVKHKNFIGIAGSLFLIVMGVYFIFFKKVKVDDSGVQVLQLSKKDYVKNISFRIFYEYTESRRFYFLAHHVYHAYYSLNRKPGHCLCYMSCICIFNGLFKSNHGAKDQEKTHAAQYSNTQPH